MSVKRKKYYFLFAAALAIIIQGNAQIGGAGGPLLNVTFGQAPGNNLFAAGPPLNVGYTAFEYSDNTCPPQGMYTIVSSIPQSCNDSSLIPLFADNTPLPDNNGYMMLINDVPHPDPKTVFQYEMFACYDVDYQFSAAIINLDKPNGAGCKRFSSFILDVRDAAGNFLGADTTGDMQFAVDNRGYHFNKYFVNFRLDSTNKLPVIIKIIDEAKAIASCHNYVAIDDIKVSVTGSSVNIYFDDTPQGYGYWVKSTCSRDNKTITMLGSVETNITNPAVQWEQSADDGYTWTDIAGANSYMLTQNFPVPDTFLFRMRLADSNLISHPGCGAGSQLLRVQVDGLPSFYSATNNSPVCSGDEIKFNAEGGATYEWQGPNDFYDNVKFPGIYKSSLKDSGWYYATIKTFGGCTVTDSTYVTIVGTDVKAWPDTVICAGNSITLNTNAAAKYTWSPVTGLSNASIQNPTASPAETTIYTVTTGDAAGCSGKGKVIVTVKNKKPVTAKISALKYVCRAADSIVFASSGTGVIDKWRWDFDNGAISTIQQPPVQYYNNIPAGISTYNVRLTVTDTAGCFAEATHAMKVEDRCNMAVPSAFTPNGDGKNDYFWPLNAFKEQDIIFTVFNRKGVKVFETKQWPDKWDGTYKGEPQNAGTYVWMFQYTDAKGKRQLQKGTVLLLR